MKATLMKATLALLIVSGLLTVGARPAGAQDPVKLSPKMYTVLLENEQVRVLEFRAKPGEKEPTHSHPAAVIYPLADGKIKLTMPDGKSEVLESKAGAALWSGPVTHSYENLATTDARVLIIELKSASSPDAGPQ